MINKLANVLVVLTCAASICIMALRWGPILTRQGKQSEYKLGQVFNKSGVAVPNQKTLVMGMWAHCSVCKHEIPAYQKIALARHVLDGQIRVVAVFPSARAYSSPPGSNIAAESQEFLSSTSLPAILSIPETFPFSATPTLLLLDASKKIIWVRRGALTPAQERELLELLS